MKKIKKIIDFHTHILPNIDDGSTSEEETIKILEEAKKVNIVEIISTSHYIEKYYEASESQRAQLFQENWEKQERNLNFPKLYLGSEIYITDSIVDLLKNRQASSINNSRYVLFELPMNTMYFKTKDIIFNLIENGFIPVIAHPERYLYVQENVEYAVELANMGALFQANYGSLIGMYGRKAKKTVKRLLEKRVIHFMGSDVHKSNSIYPKISECLKKLEKIVDEGTFEKITYLNAKKVLNNELL